MPIFEYQCNKCEKTFERLVFAGEETKVSCPECKSDDVMKNMSAVSFMGHSIGKCAINAPKEFS